MPANQSEIVLSALAAGKIELKGEFMWGSNYTFLLRIESQVEDLQAIYKPTQGVRPLWDFPSATLARREVAAFITSEALGWELVPPTVYRKDGPFGPGSIQLYIEHDPEYHYFNFTEPDRRRLQPVVLFDLLTNNADRKGSHVLFDPDQRLWAIDHGICFHVEEKLRTVIWDFAGEPIPDQYCADLARFQRALEPQSAETEPHADWASSLQPYLTAAEISALAWRAGMLAASGCFPNPDQGRRQYPWPPV